MLSFVRSMTLNGDRASSALDVFMEPKASVIVAAALVTSDSYESELVPSLPIELNSSLISFLGLI